MTDYDEVRYPGNAYPHTHAQHLYVIGRLHGMNPAPPHRCRVLEIGCGDAANLIPMAWQLPGSSFFGFDLAQTRINEGAALAREMALTNLELRHLDLIDFPASQGPFDYIIAHGFYSWVPPGVRDAMLALLKKNLAPQGIAFVSYNALPGGHIRRMIREMVLFHVAKAPDARTKLEQAKAFLGFMEQGMADADEPGRLLKAEVHRVQQFNPAHFFHDDLAAINDSFYVHEFAERAGAHGLQYLGDAELSSTQDNRMAPEVREALAELSGKTILREQYLDFLKCRRFRQTLLCHAEVTLHGEPDSAPLREFWLGGAITPGEAGEWLSPGSAKLRSAHPVATAALSAIAARWPGRWDFRSLADEVERTTGGSREDVEPILEKVLWEALTAGVIDAWAAKEDFAATVGEKPVASALARRLLQRGNSVVTMLHSTVGIGDAAGRHLILLLDGTRDVETLVREMTAFPALVEQEPDAAKRAALARENVTTGLAQLLKLTLLTA
jgi:methyltransferase-like protein